MKYLIISIFTIVLGILAACKHSLPQEELPPPPPGTGPGTGTGSGASNCDPNKVYFQQQVLPILISNCTMSGCHDVASRQDGVILTSYSNVMNTAGIKRGDPGGSKIYRAITDNDPDDRMPRPPANPLTSVQKDIIFKWIQQGAQDLTCQSACDTTAAATFNATVKPILTTKCVGCHGGTNPQAGISFSTYQGVKAKVDDGRLWGAINHQTGFSPMPKNGTKLSDCEISQIKKWMDAGALNN